MEKFFEVLKDVSYKNWHVKVGQDDDRHYLQIVFKAKCATTGSEETQRGRKWLLSTHMTKSEIVQTVFKAIMSAEEHEIRETFKYKGQAIFGPHFDVEQLAALCQVKHALDVREG